MAGLLKTHSRDRELRHEKEPKQIRRESDSKVFRCVLREWFRKKNARFHNARLQPLANQTEDATVANVASFLPVTLLADEHFTGKQGLQYAVGISVMLLPEWEASTPRKTRSDRLKILSILPDILEQPVKIDA